MLLLTSPELVVLINDDAQFFLERTGLLRVVVSVLLDTLLEFLVALLGFIAQLEDMLVELGELLDVCGS